MLADPPDVNGSKSENRSLPERLPVRRIGLEQEFFLVDRRGAPQDLADPFLRRCREAAQAAGFDPRCFKAECAKGLLEIATQPSQCRRLEEQVSSLRRRYDETLPGDGRKERAANVVWIRNSPTFSAGAES